MDHRQTVRDLLDYRAVVEATSNRAIDTIIRAVALHKRPNAIIRALTLLDVYTNLSTLPAAALASLSGDTSTDSTPDLDEAARLVMYYRHTLPRDRSAWGNCFIAARDEFLRLHSRPNAYLVAITTHAERLRTSL